jgi:hypothetical protein
VRYRALVDAMYGGTKEVRVEVEGGHADIKIRDAKIVGHGQIRSAA